MRASRKTALIFVTLVTLSFALHFILGAEVVTGNSLTTSASAAEQQPPWFHDVDDEVYSVSISSNGKYIAAGGGDNRVYLFSLTSGTPLWSYEIGGETEDIDMDSAGDYIVASDKNGGIYFFSREAGLLWSYQTGISDWGSLVSISSDGNYAAARGTDNKLYLFSRSDNAPLWDYDFRVGGTNDSVSVSADGSYIAAYLVGDTTLFSRQDNVPLWINSYYGGLSVSISSDFLVSTGWGKTALFSSQSNDPLWTYDDPEPSGLTSVTRQPGCDDKQVSISSDGEYIVSCTSFWPEYGSEVSGEVGRINLFSRSSGTPLWTYEENTDIYLVSISSDGNYIAAVDDDGKVYLFSRQSNVPLRSWTLGLDTFNSISISSDGSYIVVGRGDGINVLDKDVSNSPPTLSAGDIRSEYGMVGTTFTLEVTYTDPDGDPPEYIQAFTRTYDSEHECIDSTDLNMTKVGGDYSTGALYRCSWVPSKVGSVDIYGFEASDGKIGRDDLYGRKSVEVTSFGAILTFCKPDGTPLENTHIYYGFSSENVAEYLGTTDDEGMLGLENPELANQTIYFKTGDDKYIGSSSITPLTEDAPIVIELTESYEAEPTKAPEFPTSLIIVAVIGVMVVIGALILKKKR